MHARIKRWIFVTGTPRSGTTFVGMMLSAGARIDYIHEPFNPDCGIAGIDAPYLYLEENDLNECALRPEIERLLDYRAPLRTGIYPNDTALRRFAKRMVGSRGPFYLRLARINPFHDTAVIKDPVGCLLTEYLLLRYQMKPIVMVRNPLGVVASAQRLGWNPSLAPLLRQRRLVERFFDHSDLSVARRYENGTALQRMAVLWRLLNRALLGMAAVHPEILVVTHEEISELPIDAFARVFDHAGVSFDGRARRRVTAMTSGSRASAHPGRVQDFRRDSRGIHELHRTVLSPREIAEVETITRPVAELIYRPEALRA